MNIKLIPLQEHEKETFIRNIQIAFKKAVVEQFGPFDEEIIPRDHVIRSFEAEGAESYNIVLDGEVVGGTVLAIHPDTNRNELQLLFVNVDCHSRVLVLLHGRQSRHYTRKQRFGKPIHPTLNNETSTSTLTNAASIW